MSLLCLKSLRHDLPSPGQNSNPNLGTQCPSCWCPTPLTSFFSCHSLSYQILKTCSSQNTTCLLMSLAFVHTISTFWNNFPSTSWPSLVHSLRLNICMPSSGNFLEREKSPSAKCFYLGLILLICSREQWRSELHLTHSTWGTIQHPFSPPSFLSEPRFVLISTLLQVAPCLRASWPRALTKSGPDWSKVIPFPFTIIGSRMSCDPVLANEMCYFLRETPER